MYSARRVDLPLAVIEECSEKLASAEDFLDYTLHRAFGFTQPVAKTIALLTPIHFATILYLTNIQILLQVAVSYGVSVGMFILGLWYIRRSEIKNGYFSEVKQESSKFASLMCQGAISERVHVEKEVKLLKHNQGVMVVTEIDQSSSIFFQIKKSNDDPRWTYFLTDDFAKVEWSWVKVLGSGQICQFRTAGRTMKNSQITSTYISEFARANLLEELGDPADGEILNLTMKQINFLLD